MRTLFLCQTVKEAKKSESHCLLKGNRAYIPCLYQVSDEKSELKSLFVVMGGEQRMLMVMD